MDIIRQYDDWNKKLQQEYKCLWPKLNCLNWDGVVSPEDYFNANVKVMFLNRETYGDDYNISEAIKKKIDEGLVLFGNNRIKGKLMNRLRVLTLLEREMAGLSIEEFNQFMDSYSEDEFRNDLLKVAYCNIKKSDGVAVSKKRDLRICYLKNREIVKEQISYFNPSIIIGGNVFDGILECDETLECGEDLYASQSHYVNIYTLIIRGREYPFVDICHPSARNSNVVDRMELFKALQFVERNKPGYWKNRCGLTCFE